MFGYFRWIVPRASSIAEKGVLTLIVSTLFGGLIGSFGWWFDDPRAFAWDLEPLVGRMLASAGWSFGIACLATLRIPSYYRVRLVLWMLIVYLLPLAVAIFVFHLSAFDFFQPISIAFFLTVFLLVGLAMVFLFSQPQIVVKQKVGRSDEERIKGLTGVNTWLLGIGLVMGIWGLLLFLVPSGPNALLWAWSDMTLCSRLISVMLLTLAFAAFYSLKHPELKLVVLKLVFVYAIGIVLANSYGFFIGQNVLWLYVIVFGAIGLGTLILLSRSRT